MSKNGQLEPLVLSVGATIATASPVDSVDMKHMRLVPKVDSSEGNLVLKHGSINFTQTQTRTSFVLVPSGFNFDVEDIEDLTEMLGLRMPMLFFTFPVTCFQAFNIIQNDETGMQKFNFIPSDFDLPLNDWESMTEEVVGVKRKVLIDKVVSLLRVLAAAATQQNSWLLMETANYQDAIARLLAHALQEKDNDALLGMLCLHDSFGGRNVGSDSAYEALFDNLRNVAVAKGQSVAQVLNLDIPEQPTTGKMSEEDGLNYGGFPNPCYKKFLFFEDSAAKESFKQALRTVSYEGFVSVAGAYNTFTKVEDYMNRGLPLFVMDCSGGASSAAAKMIRFMEEKILPNGKQNDEKALAEFDSLIDDYVLKKHAQLRIRNWPENYRKDAVLVIEPLRESPSQLLDKITKAMSSVFDYVPELGAKSSEHARLQNARMAARVFEFNAEIHRHRANALQSTFVAAGLLATITATTYVYLKDIRNISSQDVITALFALNVILPAIATVALTVNSKFNPVGNWATLLSAAKQIESEIYKYRCRSGSYHPNRSSLQQQRRSSSSSSNTTAARNSTNRSGGDSGSSGGNGGEAAASALAQAGYSLPTATPAALFASKQNSIWVAVQDSEIRGGALRQPPVSYQTARDHLSAVSTKQQSLGLLLGYRHSSSTQIHPTVETSAVAVVDRDRDIGAVAIKGSAVAAATSGSSSGGSSFRKQKLDALSNSGEDLLGVLSAEEYIQQRLIPLLVEYRCAAPSLERKVQLLQLLLFITSSSAVVVAAFGLNIWLPVMFAFAGAISSILSYSQLANRLANVNAAISELTKLLNWWTGLSLIQRRLPMLKTVMVESCEAAAGAELNSWLTAVRTANRPRDQDGNGDSEAANDKKV